MCPTCTQGHPNGHACLCTTKDQFQDWLGEEKTYYKWSAQLLHR